MFHLTRTSTNRNVQLFQYPCHSQVTTLLFPPQYCVNPFSYMKIRNRRKILTSFFFICFSKFSFSSVTYLFSSSRLLLRETCCSSEFFNTATCSFNNLISAFLSAIVLRYDSSSLSNL